MPNFLACLWYSINLYLSIANVGRLFYKSWSGYQTWIYFSSINSMLRVTSIHCWNLLTRDPASISLFVLYITRVPIPCRYINFIGIFPHIWPMMGEICFQSVFVLFVASLSSGVQSPFQVRDFFGYLVVGVSEVYLLNLLPKFSIPINKWIGHKSKCWLSNTLWACKGWVSNLRPIIFTFNLIL